MTDFGLRSAYGETEKPQTPSETKYINVLGKLAGAVLEKKVNSFDECKDVLKSCAYMNLHPFSGEPSQSGEFIETLKELKKLKKSDLEEVQLSDVYDKYDKNEKIESKEVAKNRLTIIRGFICHFDCKYVVTPGNIFWALHKVLGTQGTKCWLEYKEKNKKFSYFEYEGAKMLEFWHPSYPGVSEKLIDNFKGIDLRSEDNE